MAGDTHGQVVAGVDGIQEAKRIGPRLGSIVDGLIRYGAPGPVVGGYASSQ